MSRYKPLLERNTTDKNELNGIIQNPLSDPDLTIRAKAILRFLNGMKGDAIAKELNVRPNTVSDWRKRYESEGIEGLYDKSPKGKRGSPTRNKVLEMLESQPPDGGWSTKALAEAVGTSQDTVRRALKDEHLAVSKSYIWDKDIPKIPFAVCVNVIGLYMAKEEAGLVIKVGAELCSQSSSYITTCNRSLAIFLDQMERTGRALSLEDAITAATQQMKEVYRGKKEVFQDFVGELFKEKEDRKIGRVCDENELYYIL